MKSETKKKKVSKKSKASWRKHSNIDDVNDFLEQSRQEERIGTVSDKTNEELFTVDVKADKKLILPARRRRRANALKPPKSFLGLENLSKVQDPIAKRNKVRNERTHFNDKLNRELANESKGIISKRKIRSTTDRFNSYKKQAQKEDELKRVIFSKDVWNEEDASEFNSQWIPKKTAVHNLRGMRMGKVKAPITAYEKRSKLSSIAVPHPGLSYNPSLKDHQDLMNQVLTKEEKIIKNEDHLDRVTTAQFAMTTAEKRDADNLKQMAAESSSDEDSDEVATSDDETVVRSVNAPVVVKRKDEKSRRKQREQKEIQQHLLQKKMDKKKITDLHRLKYLKAEVEVEESDLCNAQKRKLETKEQKKYEPGRLGRERFKEQDLDITLPENMSGNLRNLKVEGSLLIDRFKSMQKRNILAPSVDKGLRKRAKVKRFVRKSHKEEPVPVGGGKNKKKKKESIKILN